MKKRIALLIMLVCACVAAPSFADQVYNFTADLGEGTVVDFTYDSPDFITTDRVVPASDLSFCQPLLTNCKDVIFGFLNLPGGVLSYIQVDHFFVNEQYYLDFNGNVFGTDGTFQPADSPGILTITETPTTATPEPSSSLSIICGIVVVLSIGATGKLVAALERERILKF